MQHLFSSILCVYVDFRQRTIHFLGNKQTKCDFLGSLWKQAPDAFHFVNWPFDHSCLLYCIPFDSFKQHHNNDMVHDECDNGSKANENGDCIYRENWQTKHMLLHPKTIFPIFICVFFSSVSWNAFPPVCASVHYSRLLFPLLVLLTVVFVCFLLYIYCIKRSIRSIQRFISPVKQNILDFQSH